MRTRRHVRTAAWTALLGVALFAAPALAETRLIEFGKVAAAAVPEDFDPMMTGQGPPARWEMVDEAGAAGGKALAQVSREPAGPTFPMFVYQAISAADVSVSTRFKPVEGQIDQAGGVVLRLMDENNYYVARANALEGNVRFYRVVDGRREQLAGIDIEVTPAEWHILELSARGNDFVVTYDGRNLFSASDETFAEAGKTGLWTKADSVTYFDWVQITTGQGASK